ncbi:MAG: class I SAM-dependent methyltransferase [Candidatus Peribacteraceae bacterium]|nr:class I SAM-dependent methyltransferase [Candidatus Peribacteraceae bacterium]
MALRSLRDKAEEQNIVDAASAVIDKEFQLSPTERVDGLMNFQWHRLHVVTNGFTNLPKMRILDIGCGAKPRDGSEFTDVANRGEHAGFLPRMYEPWFARFAAACGANVTGIDRRPSPGENYEHKKIELKDASDCAALLREFDDDSFDLINSSAFLVAPSRIKEDSRWGGDVTAPELIDRLTHDQLEDLDVAITGEVKRMLKEGGYFLYNQSIYRKLNNQLEKQPDLMVSLAEFGMPVQPQKNVT